MGRVRNMNCKKKWEKLIIYKNYMQINEAILMLKKILWENSMLFSDNWKKRKKITCVYDRNIAYAAGSPFLKFFQFKKN